ncbi:MAG: hypothetical protein DDT19_01348 [Syntrophomonadaceae bacterium]|nr:hypothetical protein [Bacillota bacterium]
MKFLLSVVDAINEYTGKFYSFLVVALILTMVVEVISRYGFNKPIMGIMDVHQMFFGAYYTMAVAYVLLVGGHVKVDVLYVLLSPRRRAILDLVTAPFFFLFMAALFYSTWKFGMQATWIEGIGWNLEVDQSHLRLPVYPMKWTMFVGTFMLTLQGLAKFVRDLKFSVTGRELT